MSEIDGAPWRKSSFSGNGDCLEWLVCRDGIRVRDSKDPDGAELYFTRSEWAVFVGRLKADKLGALPMLHEERM